jgi:hypothetical protein
MKPNKQAMGIAMLLFVANNLWATENEQSKTGDPNCAPIVAAVGAAPVTGAPTTGFSMALSTMKADLPQLGEGQVPVYQNFAKKFASGLPNFNAADPRQALAVRDGMRDFNKKVIGLTPSLDSSSLNVTIQQLAASQEGKQVGTLLLEFDRTMDKLNINKIFRQPAKTLLGRIFQGASDLIPGLDILKKHFAQYQEAEGILDGKVNLINGAIEKEELAIDGEYQQNADQIAQAKITLSDVGEFLKAYYAEVEAVYKTMDEKSPNAEFIKREILTKIADRQQSTLERIVTLQQAEAALLGLMESGRDENLKARDEVSKARLSIQAGIIIAAIISRQATILKATKAIKKTSDEIQKMNAQNLLAHSMAVNGFLVDSTAIDNLVENAKIYEQVREERKKSQAARLEKYKANLPILEKVRADMERMTSEQRKEMQLHDSISGDGTVVQTSSQ